MQNFLYMHFFCITCITIDLFLTGIPIRLIKKQPHKTEDARNTEESVFREEDLSICGQGTAPYLPIYGGKARCNQLISSLKIAPATSGCLFVTANTIASRNNVSRRILSGSVFFDATD
ncbi:MAG: hypothetical protein ACYC0M_11080 [Burkholderiales bacterium]